jgi:hypothetical protein
VNTPGVDSAAAPKRTQKGLSDLLGPRFAKKTVTDVLGNRAEVVVEPEPEKIMWEHVEHT